MKLDVIVSPAFLKEDDLRGCLCAVVDVLRATSTVTTALVTGAVAMHPCLSIDEAKESAIAFGRERSLLGGEEKGQFIPGFDLGNSPLEYIAAEVVVVRKGFKGPISADKIKGEKPAGNKASDFRTVKISIKNLVLHFDIAKGIG